MALFRIPHELGGFIMEVVHEYSSDIAFTPSIKSVQRRKGSRHAYRLMEERGAWQTRITPELAVFIAKQTSIFLATVNSEGQPYIQHRGGPPGFLRVLDDETIAFVDFSGNRQYITQGNLVDNPKAHLFLIDYQHRRRIKIWGTARVVEGDFELTTELMPHGYKARPEQVVIFTVTAWDTNCSQHIPQRFDAVEVAAGVAKYSKRITALEAELTQMRAIASQINNGVQERRTDLSRSATDRRETETAAIDVVRRFYGAIGRGEVSAALSLLDAQVEWTEAEGFPYYGGTWHGPQAVLDNLLVPLLADWDGFSASANEFIAAGDRVVSLGTYSGKFKKTGRPFSAAFAHVWTVRGGKLASFTMYTDTAKVLEPMQG